VNGQVGALEHLPVAHGPLGFLTLVVEQLVLQFLRPEYIEQLRVVQYVFRLVLVQVKLGRVAQLRVFGY